MATSFHPEVDGDGRIHRLFLDLIGSRLRSTTEG
jgi:5'-phosphate synthase pdxT subunit